MKKGLFQSTKSKLLGVAAAGSMFAINAQAALVAPTFDSTDAVTVGTAVLGGLALIWGIKKAMGMAR